MLPCIKTFIVPKPNSFYCTDFFLSKNFLKFSPVLVGLGLDGEVKSGNDDNGAEEDEPAGDGEEGLLEN